MSEILRKRFRQVLCCITIVTVICAAGNCFLFSAMAESSASGDRIVVVACSDYQYPNGDVYGIGHTGNDGGAYVVSQIAGQMAENGINGVDGFLCAGDYDVDLNYSAQDTHDGIVSLTTALNNSGLTDENTKIVLTQGNHDPKSTAGGTSESGPNDPASGAYGVFVINERDYQWGSTYWDNPGLNEGKTKEISNKLKEYCDTKIAAHFTAPIFVISHVPLHYSMRTYNEGDGLHAHYIFDVLNSAASKGLNIIYLFGHDHSNGWDDYLGGSKVYLEPGDKINIADGSRDKSKETTLNFTYMNAGYSGYYNNVNNENGATGTRYDSSDLTMTCFVITGDKVEITRYNMEGQTDLKNSGVYDYYKEEDKIAKYKPNTEVVSGTVERSLINNCGNKVKWALKDRTLTISGKGAMYDFDTDFVPWKDQAASISSVVVESSVTSIGEYAFSNLKNLQNVVISSTVVKIGANAFADRDNLKVFYSGSEQDTVGLEIIQQGNDALPPFTEWHYAVYEWLDDLTLKASIDDWKQENGTVTDTVDVSLTEAVRPTGTTEGVYRFESDEFENRIFVKQSIDITISPMNELDVLDLPDELEAIETNAFVGVLFEVVLIPEECTEIASGAFAECENLVYVYAPGIDAETAKSAFEECGAFLLECKDAVIPGISNGETDNTGEPGDGI